ncbi:hypothetical protein GGQ80_003461, partial [Sphingomonas jinjuensis]|nr:hypothetical protein [Sphingomonas jinjuensis]
MAGLERLSSDELRTKWRRLTGSPVPRMSLSLLPLALAWEIQARAFGGLSRETRRTLDQLASARTRTTSVSPGMRLVREWNGRAHVVVVGDDG